MKKSAPAESVDSYLAMLPEEVRVALEKLRKIIKTAAPDTTEMISYRIPVFKLQGRPLVGLGAAKNHCSFFTMSSSMILQLAHMREIELKGYEVSGATIHFSPDKQLPAGLVTRLVKERIAENKKQAKRRIYLDDAGSFALESSETLFCHERERILEQHYANSS